ncbi:hypothetical protein [Ligilactobacillus saerimneri]|uniref:hypothetical protein n=1 Tax=Ligilactobacillus saerimneri TaxID=228229 RepID=UPI001DCF2864|nr:hypothetical protein [Ligilactobacillus saerimneri]MDI9205902.1 hypothetical protein [Ligilactobacillus saerimneri]HJF29434.1 hypothetical protein [Ligilactobacillus saerimneri]
MVVMKLINETDKYVEYALYNGNNEFIEKIRFYKDSKFLVIEGKKKMTNHYETTSYRLLLECVEDNVYPKEMSKGWG